MSHPATMALMLVYNELPQAGLWWKLGSERKKKVWVEKYKKDNWEEVDTPMGDPTEAYADGSVDTKTK